MNRMHVHVSVDDLEASSRFYTALFGLDPAVAKPDYAKWVLEDPALNFAISRRGGRPGGIDHVGIQAGDAAALTALYRRLADADFTTREEQGANCCYAHSDKHWAVDPSGVVWEMFHTMGEIAVYGDDRGVAADARQDDAGGVR